MDVEGEFNYIEAHYVLYSHVACDLFLFCARLKLKAVRYSYDPLC
jgi:hypothetical protein